MTIDSDPVTEIKIALIVIMRREQRIPHLLCEANSFQPSLFQILRMLDILSII